MPNQQIKNPEMQIQKTPQMNIRDFANDLLATEKHITDAYSTYLNEASNQAPISGIPVYFYRSSKRTKRTI